MGIFGFGLGWGYGSISNSASASIDARSARTSADNAISLSKDMEDRLNRLTLACMALWSLLQEKTGLTEEDLLARMKQIDLSDGVEDGKVAKEVLQCPQCGRVMSRRHRRCLYCDAENLQEGAFDASL